MFVNRPPTDQEKALRIIRVKPDCRLDVTIVCREFRGVFTHWTGEENEICIPGHLCKRCERGEQRRWNGYVAVKSETTHDLAMLHFTPPVAEYLVAWSLREPFLLGMMITVRRLGPLKNSPLSCERRGVDSKTREMDLKTLEALVGHLYRRCVFKSSELKSA